MRGPPRQQLIPEGVVSMGAICKIWQQHPVEEPLEQGRHRTPPYWVDNDPVLAPLDVVLRGQHGRLQSLNGLVPSPQYGIECQLAQILTPDIVSGCQSGFFVCVRNCTIET